MPFAKHVADADLINYFRSRLFLLYFIGRLPSIDALAISELKSIDMWSSVVGIVIVQSEARTGPPKYREFVYELPLVRTLE